MQAIGRVEFFFSLRVVNFNAMQSLGLFRTNRCVYQWSVYYDIQFGSSVTRSHYFYFWLLGCYIVGISTLEAEK